LQIEGNNDLENIRPLKRLGQNFLISEHIAKLEAQHAAGKNVVELGAGLGVLTRELCKVCNHVIAVEKDRRLFELLKKRLNNKNLTLINADFFNLPKSTFANCNVMVSNTPYNLSSKLIAWLESHSMEAVLCLQKEFVERMLAMPGTREYSKLSVMSRLGFKVFKLMNVSKSNFYPKPKVDSTIIYIKPIPKQINIEEASIINLLMIHKRKLLRNAVIDSCKSLQLSKDEARNIAESLHESNKRVFKLEPSKLVETAKSIENMLYNMRD